MNRRKFVAAGAGAVAVTASNATANILTRRPPVVGTRVTLSGWIRPGTVGPGHYFILGPHADIGDPRAEEFGQWPEHLTLVYPADATAIRPGPVTLEGRLQRGRFRDSVTGHAARVILTDAKPV